MILDQASFILDALYLPLTIILGHTNIVIAYYELKGVYIQISRVYNISIMNSFLVGRLWPIIVIPTVGILCLFVGRGHTREDYVIF